jgi:hypothetical protein
MKVKLVTARGGQTHFHRVRPASDGSAPSMDNHCMSRERPPQWQWVPAPGWPEPPDGWSPMPGWRPDPTWPPAPPGHRFWQRTDYGRRVGRRSVAAGVVLGLVLMGGCVALVTVAGPCTLDLPPGDFSDIKVINDWSSDVVIGTCNNDACSEVADQEDVPVGSSVNFNVESCSGGPFAVTDPGTAHLRGCVTASKPHDDNFNELPPVRVSQLRQCSTTQPATVTFVRT